ncbi:MAG: S41 family peptidase [Cyclobacteriaceae bacterium]
MPLILALGLAAGILIGATVAEKDSGERSFLSSIMKFREIITYIDRAYVDEVNTDELVETAIVKMLEKLDPHTVYIPKKEAELSNVELKGEFEGVGIEFNILKDTIYVVAPIAGGPSEKVGLMSGDKIVSVDGENVAGIGINNMMVFDLLRGTKGTEVTVGIKRKSSPSILSFTIVRDKIPRTSVEVGYMLDNEIGYIKVARFAATTYDEFMEHLTALKKQGMKKLILDLQGNPGGYMDRAINIADEFLSDNALIVSQEGKEKRYNAEYRAYRKGIFEEGPIIVLIDEGSASGSEIVAGALQDNDRALIVGRRSFGKGLVQSPISLSDGSELRLTISRYYTPTGRSIQKPYDEGLSEYHLDQRKRMEHGEYFHADSIKFNDSLVYETKKGRTVYGGGGIMPDFFVPLDTTETTAYYAQLFYSNALREYTLAYYEQNKKTLEKMKFEDFRKNFEVSDAMLNDLVKTAESADVKLNQEELDKSKRLIKVIIKAQIARSVWKNEGYYPIINDANEIYQQALKLFDEAEKLAAAM